MQGVPGRGHRGPGRAVAADAGGAAPARPLPPVVPARRSPATRDVRCHTMRRGQLRILTGCADIAARHAGLALDPAVTRDGDRILVDGEEVARSTGPIHGLAMDLGTTTVVLRLFDLETGELVADASFENPQRFGGSDVMARIQYDTEQGGFLLMRTLAGYISHAIEEFPVDPQTIYELIVVGNATMRDLFFRQNVHSIGQSPYQSITEIEMAEGKRASTSLVASGRRLLLPIHPKARVYGLPVISGHVGADAAACMLAVDLAHADRLDGGDGHRHQHRAAARPPRPHPGGVVPGRPGLRGRRDLLRDAGARRRRRDGRGARGRHVRARRDRRRPGRGALRIGPRRPAERAAPHRADERHGPLRGRRVEGRRSIRRPASACSRATSTSWPRPRAPTSPGCKVVLDTFGVDVDAIDVFYLAGGFGRHLRLESAQRIGLVPMIPAERIVQVGNAAIEGATLALLSRAKRAELEETVRRVEHCRLETHPGFFDFFVDGCQFAPVSGVVGDGGRGSPSRRPRDDRARGRPAGGAGRSGRVRAAARLSARAPPRRPGRGAGRRGRGLVRRARPAVDLRPRGVDADARRRRRAPRRAAFRQRAPAPVAGRRRGAPRGAGRGGRRARAGSGSGAAVAGREARRVLLPRGLRIRRRRAPGDASRRPPVRLGRGAGPGGAAARQPGISGVGHRRAGRAARAAHGIRGAAAGPARGARLGRAAAEEVADRRVRPDRATSSG